ncbi:DNA internalization-related competence protein ComEC/Rec2 [Pseudomonas putida SJTE-1]|uniref:DNA internalization-related competence protein ComEC/Rec2 n=3 Tax=Pseudomonas TaxID=286 RepID=A0A7L9G9C5_9PSED|nr:MULTISPECIES: DNA internalization-related competence protein ComEC/Rec2 [Pseudomonas]ANI04775.1 DNA internalization-related competence protein ComEC/Rec2 [Pseudomonas putida SJTE-1]MBX6692470.1 DNA internalization-related competence protein ComEC/Rec2 [Pseudomonas sp. USTB-Z]MEB3438021.1 DNA internalization-related competence protein ComEC/Rec2 [Pseudomonas sp. A2]QOJ88968.1 DNA internalization-related competence protein ComEC/Rec2 [Pseudomonas taiwanensis]WQQ35674.1 DNA internalization-rel
MRTGMFALALGLLCLGFLPALPSVGWLITLAACAVGSLFTRVWPLGWFLLGLCWACGSAQQALDDRLAAGLEGRTLWLEGRVAGLPARTAQGVRFELEAPRSRRAELPQRLQLSWFDGPPLRAGEQWRLAVTLQRPAGLLNPHGPDREAQLLGRRVGATGTVKAGQLLAPVAGGWRDALRQRLLMVEANGRQAALVALVLGDGAGLAREDWQTLQATGTVHLLVISGQHIGLVAGLLYGLVAGLARWGLWPARLPWLPWACGLAMAAALAYGWLAGGGVPVQRACLMLAVVLLWRLRFRHLGAFFPLLLALVAVLVFEPLAALLPGFWLSFAAVATLIYCFSARLGGWRPWQAWTRAQWVIAVGLLPVLLATGLPVSLSAPLANLVAVPWVSLAVLPLALLGTLMLPLAGVGEALLWLAGGLLDVLFRGLALVAQQRPAWVPPALPWWAWLLVCLGALLLLLPRGVPLRGLGGVMLLALWVPREPVPFGQIEVWQLDVGQGLAVLLRTRHHSLLYDAGPARGESDLGERVVLPTLRKLGVGGLDVMVISHAHADHAGGAEAIARGLPIKRIIGGEALVDVPLEPCASGEQWDWDGVRFSLWRWVDGQSSNDRSCVLLVEAQGERLLLAGDMEAAAERAWLADTEVPRIDWLQAPHHGSRSSSTEAFVRATAPRGVLISRGRNNSFGHPHVQVVERYGRHGVVMHDTAVEGALRLVLGRHGEVEGVRRQRRFWRDVGGG